MLNLPLSQLAKEFELMGFGFPYVYVAVVTLMNGILLALMVEGIVRLAGVIIARVQGRID